MRSSPNMIRWPHGQDMRIQHQIEHFWHVKEFGVARDGAAEGFKNLPTDIRWVKMYSVPNLKIFIIVCPSCVKIGLVWRLNKGIFTVAMAFRSFDYCFSSCHNTTQAKGTSYTVTTLLKQQTHDLMLHKLNFVRLFIMKTSVYTPLLYSKTWVQAWGCGRCFFSRGSPVSPHLLICPSHMS